MNHAAIVFAVFLIIFNATGVSNAYHENRRIRVARREIESKVPEEIAALRLHVTRQKATTDEDVLYFRELNQSAKSSELVFKEASLHKGLVELAEIVTERGTPLHPKMPSAKAPQCK